MCSRSPYSLLGHVSPQWSIIHHLVDALKLILLLSFHNTHSYIAIFISPKFISVFIISDVDVILVSGFAQT